MLSIWRTGLNWSTGRMWLAGRNLASPDLIFKPYQLPRVSSKITIISLRVFSQELCSNLNSTHSKCFLG